MELPREGDVLIGEVCPSSPASGGDRGSFCTWTIWQNTWKGVGIIIFEYVTIEEER